MGMQDYNRLYVGYNIPTLFRGYGWERIPKKNWTRSKPTIPHKLPNLPFVEPISKSLKPIKQIELDYIVKEFLYLYKNYQFVIQSIISELEKFLLEKIGKDFKIKVVVKSDAEFQEWKEIVFLIKTANMEFDDLISIWDETGVFIKNKIEVIKEQSINKKEIDEVYKSISIEFDAV